jgi:dsDNA-specific endonuclease/ATPase MutS2
MKEILNLLELYKNEINRLENELIEKSNIANKYQTLKEEELDALKFRYNDLIDCYNRLEESSVFKLRELRKKILGICPEKGVQIERAF